MSNKQASITLCWVLSLIVWAKFLCFFFSFLFRFFY